MSFFGPGAPSIFVCPPVPPPPCRPAGQGACQPARACALCNLPKPCIWYSQLDLMMLSDHYCLLASRRHLCQSVSSRHDKRASSQVSSGTNHSVSLSEHQQDVVSERLPILVVSTVGGLEYVGDAVRSVESGACAVSPGSILYQASKRLVIHHYHPRDADRFRAQEVPPVAHHILRQPLQWAARKPAAHIIDCCDNRRLGAHVCQPVAMLAEACVELSANRRRVVTVAVRGGPPDDAPGLTERRHRGRKSRQVSRVVADVRAEQQLKRWARIRDVSGVAPAELVHMEPPTLVLLEVRLQVGLRHDDRVVGEPHLSRA